MLCNMFLKMSGRTSVNKAIENSGTDWFIYFGPNDICVRTFCKHTLGWAFQAKDIERMNNGMLPDPLLTRGGLGCRHGWMPISEGTIQRQFPGRQVLKADEVVLKINNSLEITVLHPTEVMSQAQYENIEAKKHAEFQESLIKAGLTKTEIETLNNNIDATVTGIVNNISRAFTKK